MGFKGISREVSNLSILGCSKEVSRVFQESFKGVSKKIEGCFNGVLSKFQRYLKEAQWVFEESFKGIPRMFQGSFNVVTWKNEGCSKEVSTIF